MDLSLFSFAKAALPFPSASGQQSLEGKLLEVGPVPSPRGEPQTPKNQPSWESQAVNRSDCLGPKCPVLISAPTHRKWGDRDTDRRGFPGQTQYQRQSLPSPGTSLGCGHSLAVLRVLQGRSPWKDTAQRRLPHWRQLIWGFPPSTA